MANNTPDFDFDISQYEKPKEEEFDFDISQYSNKPENKGWWGVTQDIGSGAKTFATDVLSFLRDPARRLDALEGGINEIKGAGQQLYNQFKPEFNPFHNPYGGEELYTPANPDKNRAFKNIGAGTANATHGLINTPAYASDYLSRKGIFPESFEGSALRIPEQNYSDIFGIKGEKAGDKFLHTVGEIAPFLMGGEVGLAARGISLPRKLAQRSLAQGMHSISQNESPVPAMLGMPLAEIGLRTATKAIKSTPSLISKTAEKIGNVPKATSNAYNNVSTAFQPKKFGKVFEERYGNTINKYENHYNNLNKDVLEAGVQKIPHTDMNIPKIRKILPAEERITLDKFLENPSFENAKNLRTDILIERRAIKSQSNKTSVDRSNMYLLKEAEKNIRENIVSTLKNSKNPELAKIYREVDSGYLRDVVPLRASKAIQRFIAKDRIPEDFMKEILNDKTFRASTAYNKYPELKTARILKGLGFATKYGGLPGAGVMTANWLTSKK